MEYYIAVKENEWTDKADDNRNPNHQTMTTLTDVTRHWAAQRSPRVIYLNAPPSWHAPWTYLSSFELLISVSVTEFLRLARVLRFCTVIRNAFLSKPEKSFNMCSLVIISASNYIGSCHLLQQTDYFLKSIFNKWRKFEFYFQNSFLLTSSFKSTPKLIIWNHINVMLPKYIPFIKLTVCCVGFSLFFFWLKPTPLTGKREFCFLLFCFTY